MKHSARPNTANQIGIKSNFTTPPQSAIKTDLEKYIELMESFGLNPSVSEFRGEKTVSIEGNDGCVSFLFDSEEKYKFFYGAE